VTPTCQDPRDDPSGHVLDRPPSRTGALGLGPTADEKGAGIAVLRHQLRILRRQVVGPRYPGRTRGVCHVGAAPKRGAAASLPDHVTEGESHPPRLSEPRLNLTIHRALTVPASGECDELPRGEEQGPVGVQLLQLSHRLWRRVAGIACSPRSSRLLRRRPRGTLSYFASRSFQFVKTGRPVLGGGLRREPARQRR
jgi:hypothetical protein